MSDLDKALKTNFEQERHRMLANIVFSGNWIRSRSAEALAPHGLSNQQFNILRILRGAKGKVTMNDVKKLMIDKSPHTTRMTTKLLDKGLLQRERSTKDRRVVYVTITKKGLDLLSELDVISTETMGFIDNITEEDAKLVNSILDKLRT